MRPIGYYLHHQGVGHWQRARLVAGRLRRPCTLIGTLTAEQQQQGGAVLALPDDALAVPPPPRPGARAGDAALHYAPPGAGVLRRRSLLLAGWIAEHRPALMVVDVSVEVALLARLCATPVLYFRLAGQRDDAAHLAAFEASEALVAPFPALLDDPALPGWVRARSFHAGFLAEAPDGPPAPRPPGAPRILVVRGRGGEAAPTAAIAAAAAATPGHRWQVIGPAAPWAGPLPDNLALLGWVARPAALLQAADIIVGGCGDGLLAEVVARGQRFICLPEPRPFDEQGAKAARLAALGAALVLPAWPAAAAWPDLLRQAAALDPAALARLRTPDAVAALAAFIDDTADQAEQRYGDAG
ncbi:glycosyltransferase [Roseomonas sp. 18066]|uniref:glycosyltransferase n=1 Tax=Roseomonas sp. 18066 TaxID=2681412 RepID=UPI001358E803|nr:glycosyltransferase [Roseomonas sp. 18066]